MNKKKEKVENDKDEKQYQLVGCFYDEAGNEISIDPMVSMEAKILFVPEGETEAQQLLQGSGSWQ